MAKARKKNSWGLFLLFWVMLLLTLGFLACIFFYHYAERYEETRPEKTMDALMQSMSLDDWRETLSKTSGELNDYEDAKELYDLYFSDAVSGRELTYRRDPLNSDVTRTVFNLYAGPARLGEIVFHAKTEDGQYGLNDWELESITAMPLAGSLRAVTVQIDAPAEVGVFLNGVAIGEEQIIDPAVRMEGISALEERFSSGVKLVRYEITPLYGEITVTDDEGNEIAPVSAEEDGFVRYLIRPKETYSFAVEAPEGVVVSVCGAVLGEDEVVASDSLIFRGLDAYVGSNAYKTLRYEAGGLYSVPDIHAEYNGTELSPVIGEDGTFSFFYPDDPAATDAMRVAARDFFSAYMHYTSYKYNGAALNTLLEMILPGTELDSYFRESYDAMIWASATEVSYDELKFENFHPVGDNAFTCTILYKAEFSATSWYQSYSYAMQNGYEMVFVDNGYGWRAATMSAFD